MQPAFPCQSLNRRRPRPQAFLTTSWDDGHPLDLRLAELLHKYRVPGTFYVPRRNTRPVMDDGALRCLADEFEIGGHTISHADLLLLNAEEARFEIAGCRTDLEDVTGRACCSFAFPRGRYRRAYLAYARDAGFRCVRTVELMSIAEPVQRDGIAVIPTSIQAHATGCWAMLKNTIKRYAVVNLMTYIQRRKDNWRATAESLLDLVAERGGVFHLWGHSWEIEEYGEWGGLERLLDVISQRKQDFHLLCNGELYPATRDGTALHRGK